MSADAHDEIGRLTFDSDFPGLASVDIHPLDLCERDEVSILQSVPCLIQACDHSLLALASLATAQSCSDDLTYLLDVDDHAILGLLACWVDTCKVLSEIVEYRTGISACCSQRICRAAHPKRPLTSAAVK